MSSAYNAVSEDNNLNIVQKEINQVHLLQWASEAQILQD